jgi:glutathione synthase/RimK-type ligase-like ATP-grasp enzyme
MCAKKILLTGGRAPAVLDMARQFHESGHEVYVAEVTHMHFCKSSNAVKHSFKVPNPMTQESEYIDALVDICDKYHIDVLMPNYTEIYPIAREKARFPKHTRVFCDDIKTIDLLNNKQKFHGLCQKIGIRMPKTELITDKDTYLNLINSGSAEISYPHILKSVYCAGGMKTLTIRTPEQALSQPLEAPFLMQEFIEGRIWSTYGVAHEGRLTCHTSYYPLYTFRENGGAVCFQAHENPALLTFIEKIVAETKFSGQCGFDVMEKSDGTLYAIECNPRITSGVHLMHGHLDLFDKIDDPKAEFEIVGHTEPVKLTFLSMLTIMHTQQHSDFKTWFHYFLCSEDVVLKWSDPGPALCIPLIGCHYLKEYMNGHKHPEENIFLEVNYQVED